MDCITVQDSGPVCDGTGSTRLYPVISGVAGTEVEEFDQQNPPVISHSSCGGSDMT